MPHYDAPAYWRGLLARSLPCAPIYALNRPWYRMERLAHHERLGGLLGAVLYPLDRLLCQLPWGRTSRVVLAEVR